MIELPFRFSDAYYNFDTGQYDYHGETPDDLAPYVPQGAARNMYAAMLARGDDELEAFTRVLEICAGVEDS